MTPAPEIKKHFCTSWSGGKDAGFALWHSQNREFTPTCLLTMLKEDNKQTSAHGLHREVLEAQADCLGLPIVFGQAGFGQYEAGLKTALERVQKDHHTHHLFFGDIDLQAHKDWYETILKNSGVTPHFPLWQYDREQLLKDLFDARFETLIVSVKKDRLSQNLLGQILTPEIAGDIRQAGVCPTGEDGEFHTLLVNAPNFKKRLEVREAGIIEDDWGHVILELGIQ